ncbi:uncharacterized protein BJX67DRAFT_241514 [Aspergillus lucknowensis]|uniref:Uncharacterized protein n=1 Tax=Aspergillus lucknowensis TaxID=176173 RepID=A0ABR4LGR0_9EURO
MYCFYRAVSTYLMALFQHSDRNKENGGPRFWVESFDESRNKNLRNVMCCYTCTSTLSCACLPEKFAAGQKSFLVVECGTVVNQFMTPIKHLICFDIRTRCQNRPSPCKVTHREQLHDSDEEGAPFVTQKQECSAWRGD